MDNIDSNEECNKELSAAILKFSAKFIDVLDKKETSISSPLSAECILGLMTLATSANNPAHEELLTALGFPNDDKILSSFATLSSNLNSLKGVTLNIINKIYAKNGLEFQPHIIEDSVKVFSTYVEEVNFSDCGTVKYINDWIETNTNSKLKNVIVDGTVGASTNLLLVNAIYFKGSWAKPFKIEETKDLPFHINSKTTISIPMMTHKNDAVYRYGLSCLQAELLLLPYEGEEASMVIILPTKVDGVDAILTKLAEGYDLMTEIVKLTEHQVDITIPKFKVETMIDLTNVLHKLGVKSMFYSGLDKMLMNNESVSVTRGVQKAFIEVNEEGTEAAAVTYVPTVFCSPPHFNANRPFVYLLMGPGNTVLFMGTYRGDSKAPRIKIGSSRWDFFKKIFRRK